MITNRRNTTWAAVTIGTVVGAFNVSSAAPPNRGDPPPAADVAYMSLSYKGTISTPDKASVRGMAITAAGTAGSDGELWRSATRSTSAIPWDPTGTWLAWFQESSDRGTPSIAIGTPGSAPRTAYVFSLEFLWTTTMSDSMSWGRGCNGSAVLYFMGNKGPALTTPTLWVLDPFATDAQPQEIYATVRAVSGLAVSPLGRFVALGDSSAAFGGQAGILVLPMTCVPGNALPVAAGPAQPLFAIRYDADLGWATGMDWSGDGRRLAISMGRQVPKDGGGGSWLYAPELWVAELDYLADTDSEQVTFGSLQHLPSGPALSPSWAPIIDTEACDRLAFAAAGSVQLLDVPRPGFASSDCAIPSPTSLGGKSVGALDWK
jgi:hypothetical protein